MSDREQPRRGLYMASLARCPNCHQIFEEGPRIYPEDLINLQKEEVAMPEIEQRRGKFWVVWIEEASYFTLIVDSKEPAYKEAEKLARLNPGKLVYLLEAVEYCQATSIEWERL